MKKVHKMNISSEKFVLLDILSRVKEDIADNNIVIFEFDGLMKKNSNIKINKLIDNAISNVDGHLISFEDLNLFAENIEQTYDLILAANTLMPTKFKDDDHWRSGNDLVIEMLDCGDWEVSSTNTSIIRKLQDMELA